MTNIVEVFINKSTVCCSFGGIIPPLARILHEENIHKAADEALKNAEMSLNDIDAIAVTNRPGLPLSLLVGVKYAKSLATSSRKPLIPIHHMEAHALTIRMVEKASYAIFPEDNLECL